MTKSTDIDFKMNAEETDQGTAMISSSWSISVPGSRFNTSIESITDHSVSAAIGLMSELQNNMVQFIRAWGEKHGTKSE